MKSTTKVIVLCLSFYFFSISVTAQNLDLSNLGLTQVPDSVWSKKDIVSLNLSGNNIRFISNKIDSLQALQSINLKDNPIQKLPEEFFSSKIHIINVSNTPLYDDPEFYNSIKQKEITLVLEGVDKLPRAIQKTKSIKHLRFVNTNIKDSVINNYSNIQSIDIQSENQKLNKIVYAFPKLRKFGYQGSESFDLNLEPLKKLRELSLKGVQVNLEHLLNQGVKLHTIRLIGAGLKEIPRQLSQLKKLQILDVSENELASYIIKPKEFKNLKLLDIRGSEISSKQLNRIYRNTTASVKFDPINEVIPEIAPEYQNKFKEYLLSNEDTRSLEIDEGLTLNIPSESFELLDGTAYEGIVKFKYRSFNDPFDFVFSGIPMSFQDETGWDYFESLKMFEIKAYTTEGKELKLRVGKSIKARYTSQNASNFKGWYLDTNRGVWDELPLKTDSTVLITSKQGDELSEMEPPYRMPRESPFTYDEELPIKPEYTDYRSIQKIYSDFTVWNENGKRNYAVYLAQKLTPADKKNIWLKQLYEVKALHQLDLKLANENEFKKVSRFCKSENILMLKVSLENDHCIIKLDGSQTSIQFNALPLKEDKTPMSLEEIKKLIDKINIQVGVRVREWSKIDEMANAKYEKYKEDEKEYFSKVKEYNQDREKAKQKHESDYFERMKKYKENLAVWENMSPTAKSASLNLIREVNYIREFEFPNLGTCNIDTRQRLAKEIEKAELIAKRIFVKAPSKGVDLKNYYLCDKRKNSIVSFSTSIPKIESHKQKSMIVIFDNGDFGLVKSKGLKRHIKGKKMKPKIYSANNFNINDLKRVAF